jgi:hypothetical protein
MTYDLDDPVGSRAFIQEGIRSRGNCLGPQTISRTDCHDSDSPHGHQVTKKLKPIVGVGEQEIEHDHGRSQSLYLLSGLVRIGGLAHDLDVVQTVEQRPEPPTDTGVVIDDEQAEWL